MTIKEPALIKPTYLRLFRFVCIAIVAAGLVLRVIVFLQNRDLILDEVNLIRNLHERSFAELLRPLDYNQFAPIPFILFSKLEFVIFGGYEWAVRIYPLVTGLLALIAFYFLLKKLQLFPGGIYSLLLIAFGVLYIRYATEFKQYSSDQLVSTCLLIAALHYYPGSISDRKFGVIWTLIGGFAIWISMPSVFVLAGIGTYFLLCFGIKDSRKALWTVLLVMLFWISQFIANYYFFLKPSIQSNYLQNWHRPYFLTVPKNAVDWSANLDTIGEFWNALGGHWALSSITNLVLTLAGIFFLARNSKSYLLLLLLPVILLLLAAVLHQYTLLPRVCLFVYPLLLVLIAYGLQYLLSGRKAKFISPVLILSCLINAFNFSSFRYFVTPLKNEWTSDNISWIRSHHVPARNVFVHDVAWPQYQYYLTIRPDSSNWADLKGITPFYWNTNLDSLCSNTHGSLVFAFSWIDENELTSFSAITNKYCSTPDSVVNPDRHIYLKVRH